MIPPVTVAAAASKPEMPPAQLEKLRKGAREFESMLVEQIWKGMKSESEDSGSGQTLTDMGSHAFAAGIAARGGFGVANMILRQLAPAAGASTGSSAGPGPSPASGTATLKPPATTADHVSGE
jgi:Rod binding domain-containing protein